MRRVTCPVATLTAVAALFYAQHASAQCRFPGSDSRSTLTYRFRPEVAGVGPVIHVTLEMPVGRSGQEALVLPTRWAGETLNVVRNLKAVSNNATIETALESGPILRATPNQIATITYDLTKDWSGRLVNPGQFHPVLAPEYFEFTGSNALVRPELAADTAVTTNFDWQALPGTWTLATSFGTATTLAARCQRHVGPWLDYVHGLYAAGDFRIHQFSIGRRKAVLAIRSAWTFTDEDAIRDLRRVIGVVRDYWRDDKFPYFLVTLKPYDLDRGSGNGSAFTDAFWMYLSRQDSLTSVLPLLAHEAFHAWNPLKMGFLSAESDRATTWFKEGFTSYFAPILVYRAGVLSLTDYVESLNRDLREFQVSSDPYVRGRIIALWLDGAIRAESRGKRSLDDVMFEMVRQAARPLTLDRILATANRFVGVSAREQLRQAIENRGNLIPPPSAPSMSCLTAVLQELSTFDVGLDVVRTRLAAQITGVVPGGPAYAAGLRDGQELVGISVTNGDPNRTARFTVRTSAGEQQISYYPRGAMVSAWQYRIDSATTCGAK